VLLLIARGEEVVRRIEVTHVHDPWVSLLTGATRELVAASGLPHGEATTHRPLRS
jgi:hypothetical protein